MRMVVLPPETFLLLPAGRGFGQTIRPFRTSACQRSFRTAVAWSAKILCRDRRQAPIMDTLRRRAQAKSGKRNLTHYILCSAAVPKPKQYGGSQEGRANPPKYLIPQVRTSCARAVDGG